VRANYGKNWNWFELSKNKNITLEIVKNNPLYQWNKDGLKENENIISC
jgi:hypothetical protein